MIEVLKQNWHIFIIAGILLWIFIDFIWKFLISSIQLLKDLRNTIKKLEEYSIQVNKRVIDLDEISNKIMTSKRFKHLWDEYRETLHPQKQINNLGQEEIVCWRSTTMAETFFTEQALVVSPLKTEYYKHLPGILTGIGIIGTFAGLIQGLIRFKVSEDPNLARSSLNDLVLSVGHAFLVSVTAIILAMLFTWIEKLRVTKCYREVEKLCQLIDSFFEAGAGEEYLARLVEAAETSATQAAQIKDSLVADLKQILSDLTNQQINASSQNNHQLAANISQSINDSIKEPFNRISEAVNQVGANQGEAVNTLLADVLTSFTAKLNDMVGGQLYGINDVLQNTTMAIQGASSQITQLTQNIQLAGTSAVDAMAQRIDTTLNSIDARHGIMNKQLGEFVDQIRALLHTSQAETSQKMQSILEEMGSKVVAVVGQLETQSQRSADEYKNSHDSFTDNASTLIGRINSQFQTLADRLDQAVVVMQNSISAMTTATTESINKLNTGAETLYIASSDFVKAGLQVNNSIKNTGQLMSNIESVSTNLTTASISVKEVMTKYAQTNDTFASVVANLKEIIENAKKEASLTLDIVSQFEIAASRLGLAQKGAEEYLENLTEVLSKTHEDFADNITKTLRASNSAFHEDLSSAVSLVRRAIQDFGDELDSFMAKRA